MLMAGGVEEAHGSIVVGVLLEFGWESSWCWRGVGAVVAWLWGFGALGLEVGFAEVKGLAVVMEC